MKLPQEMLTDLLARWPVARLATVSGRGRPHLVPVVFCEFDHAIYSPLDGKRKTGTRLQRLVNLVGNASASLLIDDYTSEWRCLWWVRIDGSARWCSPAPADAGAIARTLVAKYPQYRDPSLMFDTSSYLQLRPSKITAWAQSGAVSTIAAAIRGNTAR